MQRRGFMGACSGALLCSAMAGPQPVFARSAKPQAYERVRLLDEHGRPLRASTLPKRRNLVFTYPYVATPAFLLDLGKPAAPTSGLPDGSGHEVMRRLHRNGAAGRAVPGIALSGYGMDEDLRRSAEAGFAAHLTKPVDLARLQATIAHVLGAGR